MLPSFRETPPPLDQTVTDASPVMPGAASGPVAEGLRAPGLWLRVAGLGLAMGFFLSFVGALGTGEAPFLKRLGYWEIVMVAGSLVAAGVNFGLRVYLISAWRSLFQDAACIIATTLLITAMVWVITPAYWNHSLDARALWVFVPVVFVITLIMTLLNLVLDRRPRQSHAFSPEITDSRSADHAPDLARIAFFERLPAKFQSAEIRAVSGEDHYLRVHTNLGQTLILMRLYDAIRELEGIEGSQTHRSWWVAKAAIHAVVRRDGRIALRLEGDLTAPVSRSFQKALKADGWI